MSSLLDPTGLNFKKPTHPVHLTHLKTDKNFFQTEWGIVAYEKVKNINVVAGPPMGKVRALQEFTEWSHKRGLGVCGYYFPEGVVSPPGLKKYQIGVSRSLNLGFFDGRGYKWRDFRRALNQGHRFHLKFEEISNQSPFLGEIIQLEDQWKSVPKSWLRRKKIGFLLSPASSILRLSERVFCVKQGKTLAALTSILPYWEGDQKSYYIDTLIQSPIAQRFSLDFLLSQLILLLQHEEAYKLNFGLCAFQGVRKKGLFEWLIALNGSLNFFYNSMGLYVYKKKFTDIEESEYLLMDSRRTFLEQMRTLYAVTWPEL